MNHKYTDEEKQAQFDEFEKQGYDKAEIEKQTGRDADGYVHLELLYQKVLEFLVENAEIK